MKKFFALLIALILVMSFAACKDIVTDDVSVPASNDSGETSVIEVESFEISVDSVDVSEDVSVEDSTEEVTSIESSETTLSSEDSFVKSPEAAISGE